MQQRGIASTSAALCTFISEYLEENSFDTLTGRIKNLERRIAVLESTEESF